MLTTAISIIHFNSHARTATAPFLLDSKAESFYSVNYGSSIITSNNLSNENINTYVSVVFNVYDVFKTK